jgi:S-adenosylmethionine decarboxylase
LTVHFEGAEKSLEVVVAKGAGSLRARGDAYFRALVAEADGSVIRATRTHDVDAYLLAESSLFVSDRHLSMLTCGRTRVYRAAEKLIADLGADAIDALSLTRFGERFPNEQHSALADDARVLATKLDGALVRLGAGAPHAGGAFIFERPGRTRVAGETRMRFVANDIDAEVARVFEGEVRNEQTRVLLPIAARMGEAVRDGFDFAPSGYSMNAVDEVYTWALHVTPEPASSYVSLVSSDEDEDNVAGLVRDALATFRPKTCLVTTEFPLVLPDGYVVAHEGRVAIGGHTVQVTEATLR